jgi:hypothetical protein
MTSTFDLVEFQRNVRESHDPVVIYRTWESVCNRYDAREIGSYEFEEMKEVVFARLHVLNDLKKMFK